MTDLSSTSTTYQRTVRRAYADIVAGRIRRMTYAELHTAIEALWAARQRPITPVKPVVRERIPF
jgi:hypothetical protein